MQRIIMTEKARRVKKVVASGETTVFVDDASGQLVAEYSTVVAPATEAKVGYLTTDHLGSPRIITNQKGAVYTRNTIFKVKSYF